MRSPLVAVLAFVALASAACSDSTGPNESPATPPTLQSASPDRGTVGTEVRVDGIGFDADSVAVFFGDLEAPGVQREGDALFVPARAHHALPIFDQPDLKGIFRLELIAPPGSTILANAPEADPPFFKVPKVIGGDDDTGGTLVSGTFVDSPVNGLNYVGNPSGTSGVTGDNGTDGGFTVEDDDTVTFSISGLTLGTSQAVGSGAVVTPAELAGNRLNASNARALRIARLLQSLDEDGDTSNGITISTATRDAIAALGSSERDDLSATLISGTNYDSQFGAIIDDLTAGNSVPRSEGDLVNAVDAEIELLAAVNTATGGGGIGSDSGSLYDGPVFTAELYDPATGRFTMTGVRSFQPCRSRNVPSRQTQSARPVMDITLSIP